MEAKVNEEGAAEHDKASTQQVTDNVPAADTITPEDQQHLQQDGMKQTGGSSTSPSARATRHHHRLAAPQTTRRRGHEDWETRYDLLVQTNQRLKKYIQELQQQRSKRLVRSQQQIPNATISSSSSHQRAHETFVGELLMENHSLLRKLRAKELRIAQLSGSGASEVESFLVRSPTPRNRTKQLQAHGPAPKKKPMRRPLCKEIGAQTDPCVISNQQDQDQGQAQNTESDQEPISHVMRKHMKQRLAQLELDLRRLQQENDLLRTTTQVDGTNLGSPVPLEMQMQLECALQESLQRLSTLELRYSKLQQALQTQANAYHTQVAQNDQRVQEIVDLRQQLDQTRLELVDSQALEAQNRLLRQEKILLQQEVEDLHHAIDTLSQRPLENLGQQLQSKNVQIGQLESENTALQRTIFELQQANKRQSRQQHQICTQKETLMLENEQLQQQIGSLQSQNEQLQLENEVVTLRLRWYVQPQDRQVMEAMGKTLKQMQHDQRQQQQQQQQLTKHANVIEMPSQTVPASSSSLSSECSCSKAKKTKNQNSGESSDQELVQLLKNEHELQRDQIRFAHRQTCFRMQKTIDAQQKQLEQLMQQLTKMQVEKNNLTKATETRMAWLTTRPHDNSNHGASARAKANQALESTNVLEICLEWIEFDLTNQNHEDFVLFCDFFDYETQMSQVLVARTGSQSTSSVAISQQRQRKSRQLTIDFTMTFKFVPSVEFFCHPLSHSIQIELHHVPKQSAQPNTTDHCIATASLSLKPLFLAATGQQCRTVGLRSVHSHQAVVAKLSVRQSLQQPVDKVFESCLALNDTLHRSQRAKYSEKRVANHLETSDQLLNAREPAGCLSIGVNVIAVCLNHPSVLAWEQQQQHRHEDLTQHRQWFLKYRFVGYPIVWVPIEWMEGSWVGLLNHQRSFEFPNRRESLEILSKLSVQVTLCFRQHQGNDIETAPESEICLGHVVVSLKVFLQGLGLKDGHRHHHTQLLCSLQLAPETTTSQPELGRVSLELSIHRGEEVEAPEQVPSVWNEPLKSSLLSLIRRWSKSCKGDDASLVVNLSKLHLTMNLPKPIQLVRQLLFEHMSNVKLSTLRLGQQLQQWQQHKFSNVDCWERKQNLATRLQHAFISLSTTELDLVWAILTHLPHDQRNGWLEIIWASCCCTEWLQLDQQNHEQMRLLATKLKSFVEGDGHPLEISWCDFEQQFLS